MSSTSYFARLFIDLSDHIKANVPEIKWIDQDIGQLEEYEQRPAVLFPCVLLDFAAASYDELTELAQTGNVIVIARIGFPPFSPSNGNAPTLVREKAVAYYELEQKVYECIQGWQTAYTAPLIRTLAETERRDDTIRVRQLTFSTWYDDTSCTPARTMSAAQLVIDPGLLE